MAEFAGTVEIEWPADKDGLPLYSGDMRIVDSTTKELVPGITIAEVIITAQIGSPLRLRAQQLTVDGHPIHPGEKATPDQISEKEFIYRITAMRIREKT